MESNKRMQVVAAEVNFASIAASSTAESTVTVEGVRVGDAVMVAPPTGFLTGVVASAYVSADNTVKVRLANVTAGAIDPDDDGTKEVITVDIGTASAGTFTLTIGGQTTTGIAFNASAGTVETAVEALAIVVAATVTGTGATGTPWIITIDDPITPLTLTSSGAGLTGGPLTAAITTPGVAPSSIYTLYIQG